MDSSDRVPMPDETDSVLTIDDLARYLKVSKSTLYKLCQEGQVPGRKIGRHWRFSKVVIDEWMKETGVLGAGGAKQK